MSGLGLRSEKRGQAVGGLVTSILGLIGTVVMAIAGAIAGLALLSGF
jgi:hypothetical protein